MKLNLNVLPQLIFSLVVIFAIYYFFGFEIAVLFSLGGLSAEVASIRFRLEKVA